MKYFEKGNPTYNEFFGVNAIGGLLMILNGIADLLLCPFNVRCHIHVSFCEYRLRRGIAKRKRERKMNGVVK